MVNPSSEAEPRGGKRLPANGGIDPASFKFEMKDCFQILTMAFCRSFLVGAGHIAGAAVVFGVAYYFWVR